MMGTRKALKKNIIDSSSTTPYSSLYTFPKAKSSTKRVINAVAKKSPNKNLRPKDSSYSLPVLCFSKSVRICIIKVRMNLLKRMISSIVRKVAAVARCKSVFPIGSSGFYLISLKDYSTKRPFANKIT